MATNFTNQKASQSLRGQAVLVTLNSSDAGNLYKVTKGALCTNNSSGKTGTVATVNVYGNSFWVSPIQPDRTFESSGTYGYLAANETVIVNV